MDSLALWHENTANAKSVLSVLGACVKCGDEIEFVCEGEDEAEALKTLVEAVESTIFWMNNRQVAVALLFAPFSAACRLCFSSVIYCFYIGDVYKRQA